MKFFREERGEERQKGGGRVMFWMEFKELAHLRDVDGTDGVEIKKEAVFLKEGEHKGRVFDGVETNGGLEGCMDCSKVAGKNWRGEEGIEAIRIMWK